MWTTVTAGNTMVNQRTQVIREVQLQTREMEGKGKEGILMFCILNVIQGLVPEASANSRLGCPPP